MRMKYIVLNNSLPFIFPAMMVHKEFAESVINHIIVFDHIVCKVTSAGFVRYGECYGESTSLDIKSSENDNKLLTKMFG